MPLNYSVERKAAVPATAQPASTAQAEHNVGLFRHSRADMVTPTSLHCLCHLTHTQILALRAETFHLLVAAIVELQTHVQE